MCVYIISWKYKQVYSLTFGHRKNYIFKNYLFLDIAKIIYLNSKYLKI